MYIIPTNVEMENICADLRYYAKRDKIEALVGVARFLKRIGSRDLIQVFREYIFDNSTLSYQDGELIAEHKTMIRNIRKFFI